MKKNNMKSNGIKAAVMFVVMALIGFMIDLTNRFIKPLGLKSAWQMIRGIFFVFFFVVGFLFFVLRGVEFIYNLLLH